MRTETSRLLLECVENCVEKAGSDLNDITIEKVTLGLFFTGVKLSSGQASLCFTPVKDMPQAVCCPSSANAMPYAGKMSGKPVWQFIEYVLDDNPLKRAIGIATLNAVSDYVRTCGGDDFKGGTILTYGDAFDDIKIGEKTKAIVVGALVPVMKKLKEAEADWTVLELDPRTLKEDELSHYMPYEKAPEVIPDADLLIITGVTILNDTLSDILELASPDAEILVTGPTVSMLPDPLFEHGVTVIGGVKVTDPDKALKLIAEGGSGYHLFGSCAERTIERLR